MFNAIRQACPAIKNMFAAPAVKEAVAVPVVNAEVVTMSSREVAELTGKDHKNVIRDIRVMLEELDGSDLSHVREELDGRGYTSNFHMDKEMTLTLVAGYNVRLRHAIIKRWQELEQNAITRAQTLLDSSVTSCTAFCCF